MSIRKPMQLALAKFSKNDLAKYPFLKAAAQYMRMSDLKVEDLTRPDLKEILKRAEERLEEAILYARVSRRLKREDVEISSYPVAIILAIATGSSFVSRRYALAEAKQVYEDLKRESSAKILEFARNFEWTLNFNVDPEIPYEFTLIYPDYLRNTTRLRGKKWKLVNRLLSHGTVYLTRIDAARLLSEEVRRHIEDRLGKKELPRFPSEIIKTAERIKKLSVEKIGRTEVQTFPKVTVQSAFPPCIATLQRAATTGRHLSHVGRFTLTSFLASIGTAPDSIVEIFKNSADFNERMTRYQVEHIAGTRGSRTQYAPPRCVILQTHGVCVNPDALCRKTYHPLDYYQRKARTTNSKSI